MHPAGLLIRVQFRKRVSSRCEGLAEDFSFRVFQLRASIGRQPDRSRPVDQIRLRESLLLDEGVEPAEERPTEYRSPPIHKPSCLASQSKVRTGDLSVRNPFFTPGGNLPDFQIGNGGQ